MVLRQIAGPDGQPAMDIFCFAYAYNDEDQSELVRQRVQAHALRVGESGYLSRLLLTSEDGAYGYILLLGVAFKQSTGELLESADWGEGAIEIAAQVSDEMWTQAINSHLQISLDHGADRFNEINYPEGARPILDYGSGEQINDPNDAG
jgi:flavorubredoxin